MKFLALLLFVAEFLSPALLASGMDDGPGWETSLTPVEKHCNIAVASFIEEGKEEKADHDLPLTVLPMHPQMRQVSDTSALSFSEKFDQITTHPPLFRILCTLLI